MPAEKIHALILAGNRQKPDPILSVYAVPSKAFIKLDGAILIHHVIRALSSHDIIGSIYIYSDTPEQMHGALSDHYYPEHVNFHYLKSKRTIAATLDAYFSEQDNDAATIVTTADNALLTGTMVREFLQHAVPNDIAVALVERANYSKQFDDTQRTWLKFRGGHWSGANLFWFGGKRVRPVINVWRNIEQQRKKGWRVIAEFGFFNLILAALRLITLHDTATRIGRRFGLNVRVIEMSDPAACIDIDKPSDLELAETILDARS